MKLETRSTHFSPVSLVIETQEEFNLITSLIGNLTPTVEKHFKIVPGSFVRLYTTMEQQCNDVELNLTISLTEQ